MKKNKLLAINLLLLYLLPGFSQDFSRKLIDFEESYPWIKIDTTIQGNIWQIGTPDKLNFDSAFSGKKVIITDTINPYPVGNLSAFILKIDSNYVDRMQTSLSFWHKWDTDTLKDYGYIEYSFDGGLSWQLLIDTSYYNCCGEGFGYWEHFDKSGDNSWYGNLNVTGVANDWIHSTYNWIWWLPAKIDKPNDNSDLKLKNAQLIIDSLMVKFVFISDLTGESRSGWIIDNIEVFETLIPATNTTNNSEISIYPNPAGQKLNIKLPDNIFSARYIIYSTDGKMQLSGDIYNNFCEVDLARIINGTYIIKIWNSEKMILSKNIIIK
jgi:hypothetical protein